MFWLWCELVVIYAMSSHLHLLFNFKMICSLLTRGICNKLFQCIPKDPERRAGQRSSFNLFFPGNRPVQKSWNLKIGNEVLPIGAFIILVVFSESFYLPSLLFWNILRTLLLHLYLSFWYISPIANVIFPSPAQLANCGFLSILADLALELLWMERFEGVLSSPPFHSSFLTCFPFISAPSLICSWSLL